MMGGGAKRHSRRVFPTAAQSAGDRPFRSSVMRAMNGLEHLRNAGRALHNGFADPREALQAAADEFWRGVFYAPAWPEDLRKAAEEVYPSILLRGSIQRTIAELDDAGLTEARRKIEDFCTLAERVLGAPTAVRPSSTA